MLNPKIKPLRSKELSVLGCIRDWISGQIQEHSTFLILVLNLRIYVRLHSKKLGSDFIVLTCLKRVLALFMNYSVLVSCYKYSHIHRGQIPQCTHTHENAHKQTLTFTRKQIGSSYK